jgi:hypothetical protein
MLNAHGVAQNGGRHYLISVLADKRYPIYLRRALSGHGARAGAAYHSASGVSPIFVLSELRQALEEELSFCCIGDSWVRWIQRFRLNAQAQFLVLLR